MSQYLNIYLSAGNGDLINIANYARTHPIYCDVPYVPYGKLRKVTESELEALQRDLEDDLQEAKKQIANYQKLIDTIGKMEHVSFDEKLQACIDYENEIKAIQSEVIDCLEQSIAEACFLLRVLWADEDNKLWWGIEAEGIRPGLSSSRE